MHYFTILSFSTLVLLATVLSAERKVAMLKTTELLYNRLTDLYFSLCCIGAALSRPAKGQKWMSQMS
jgi:hypothetical protein